MDALPGLGMDDRDGETLEQAQRHETLFVITEAIILVGERGASEYPFGVHEIEAMVPQVPLAFRLVPREPHPLLYILNVYTSRGLGRCG